MRIQQYTIQTITYKAHPTAARGGSMNDSVWHELNFVFNQDCINK